jgi:hypothetical protein
MGLVAVPAMAGTIGFRTDVEVTSGPGIDAKVGLTHTGDEAATGVRVRADVLGRSVEGAELPSMAPTQSHEWTLHLADDVPKGIYAILLHTRYSDDNGYPFEVISSAVAQVGVRPAPRIFGSVDVPRLPVGGEVVARVTAKKPPTRTGDYRARLVVPDGLEVTPASVVLQFDQTGKAKAEFRLRNRRLLAGTSVNVFAVVSGRQGDFPQDDTIRGTVTIGAAEVKVTAAAFYRFAGILGGLLFLMEATAWVLARRSASV